MSKNNCLVGKIDSSGVQVIKAPAAGKAKKGKSAVKRGGDLRTKGK